MTEIACAVREPHAHEPYPPAAIGWYATIMLGFLYWMSLLVADIIGKFLGGLSVDAMYRRGYRDAQLRWFAYCLLLAAPTGAYAATSGNPWLFLVMIGVFTALLTSLQACAMSSLNLVTPNRMRGAGVALYSTVAGLLGGSLGSIAVPMLAQLYTDPDTAIGKGMATLIGLACPLAAFALFTGLKAMRKAMAVEEAEGSG